MTDKARRISPLPREEWTDETREVFAFWGEPDSWNNGSKTNIVMVQAQHPKLTMAHNALGKHLLIDSTLPVRPRELVVLRTSWNLKSEYEWHYHVGYALNAGMSLQEIAAIGIGPSAPNWNEQDRAVLSAADELRENARITDPTWTILARHFDTPQLMDLVFTIGNYVMLSWAIASFDVALENGVDKIGFDLKTASGRIPGATYRPRETEDWASNRGQ